MLAAAVPSDLSNFLRSIEVVSVALRMKAKCFNIQFWKVWPPPGLASLHAGSVSARGPFLSPSCSPGSFPPHGLCSSLLFPPRSPTQLLCSSRSLPQRNLPARSMPCWRSPWHWGHVSLPPSHPLMFTFLSPCGQTVGLSCLPLCPQCLEHCRVHSK